MRALAGARETSSQDGLCGLGSGGRACYSILCTGSVPFVRHIVFAFSSRFTPHLRTGLTRATWLVNMFAGCARGTAAFMGVAQVKRVADIEAPASVMCAHASGQAHGHRSVSTASALTEASEPRSRGARACRSSPGLPARGAWQHCTWVGQRAWCASLLVAGGQGQQHDSLAPRRRHRHCTPKAGCVGYWRGHGASDHMACVCLGIESCRRGACTHPFRTFQTHVGSARKKCPSAFTSRKSA